MPKELSERAEAKRDLARRIRRMAQALSVDDSAKAKLTKHAEEIEAEVAGLEALIATAAAGQGLVGEERAGMNGDVRFETPVRVKIGKPFRANIETARQAIDAIEVLPSVKRKAPHWLEAAGILHNAIDRSTDSGICKLAEVALRAALLREGWLE